MRQAARKRSADTGKARYGIIIGIVALVLLMVLVGVLYWSRVFSVEEITYTGADHLTQQDLENLVVIEDNATLFRFDAKALREGFLRDAWVEDVSVKRRFPHTLEVVITERSVDAVVNMPSASGYASQKWAISSDGVWLMPIPERDSEAGRATSPRIYEDIENTLTITDVPFTSAPEIGKKCTDPNVNNALDVVASLTTDLANRVKSVRVPNAQTVTLTVKDGPDVVFGDSNNVREKERVCLAIMDENSGSVSYINVSDPSHPTWRSL